MDATTVYLAQLMGPIFLAMGLSMVLNFKWFKKVIKDLFNSRALVFIVGLMTFIAGLAMVLAHNIWELSRPTLFITIVSWATLIKGFFYLVLPNVTYKMMKATFGNRVLYFGVFFMILFGICLSYYGYWDMILAV